MNDKIKFKIDKMNEIMYTNKDADELLIIISMHGLDNRLTTEFYEIANEINFLPYEE